jgi:hypothetical protein
MCTFGDKGTKLLRYDRGKVCTIMVLEKAFRELASASLPTGSIWQLGLWEIPVLKKETLYNVIINR